jgi:hypothetical protein
MADFFFFTDIDKIKAQTAGQNFGPVISGDPDYNSTKERFRLTSVNTATADCNAYAICDGEVFVIEDQSNTNLLNLVLKPYKQPVQGLPKIKYYIYKGIRKDSLISGTQIADPSQAASNNDLTQRIWSSEANASSNALLPPTNSVVTDKIYTSFYKNDPTTSESQIPKVFAGDKIGIFLSTGFGLEIITDDADILHEEIVSAQTLYYSDPSYRYVKQTTNYVEVNVPMSPSNQNDFFLKRNIKERILRYLDPCAFWGSFYDSELKYKNSSNSTQPASGNTVFKEVLYGTSPNAPFFTNRNRVYIDVRNDLNYSYDFFNNYQIYNFTSNLYTQQIKVAFDAYPNSSSFSGFVDKDYYRNSWPIFIIEKDFALNNSNNPNTFQVSLPKGDNENPIVFVSRGNFTLTKKFKYPFKKRLEYIDYNNSSGNYTQELKFQLNNFYDTALPNSTSYAWNISNYYKIKLLKQISQCPVPTSTGSIINREELLDNIFLPLSMEIEWNTINFVDPVIKTRIYENETWIDAISLNGQSGIGNIGMAEFNDGNDDYITLFAIINYKTVDNRGSHNKKINLESEVISSDGTLTFIKAFSSRYNLKYKSDPITGVFNGVNLSAAINESLKNKGFPANTKFTNVDADDIIYLTIKKTDFLATLSAYSANFLPGFKNHLAVKFNSGQVPDPNTHHGAFIIFQLKLRGWILDNTDNNIKVAENIVLPSNIYALLPSRRIFLEQTPPRHFGKGYKIEQVLGTFNYTEPDVFDRLHTPVSDFNNKSPKDFDNNTTPGNKTPTTTSLGSDSNPIKKYKIISTIYVIRGINLSATQFCKLRNYIETNIKNVWDSSTNMGLAVHFEPTEETAQLNDKFVRHYLFDSSGIEVKVATARQLKKLKVGEVLLYADASPNGRSFISGAQNHRVGEFYYNTADDFQTEINLYGSAGNASPNTAAHEFGHVLGLADRYTYFAFLNLHGNWPAVKRDFISDQQPGDTINGIKRNAGTTGLYLGKKEDGSDHPDGEYNKRFNWLNNLMTSQSIVPEYDYEDLATYNNDKNLVQPPDSNPVGTGNGTGSAVTLPLNYRRVNRSYYIYHSYFRPWIVPASSPKVYSKVCVFITKDQANMIIQGTEEDLDNFVNFKKFLYNPEQNPSTINVPNPIYTGTFAGPSQFDQGSSGGNIKKVIKSDDEIESYSPNNYSLTTYDANLHSMEGRLLTTTVSANIFSLKKTFTAYFNPFVQGTDVISESLIYPTDGPYGDDEYMFEVYYPNKPDEANVVPDGGLAVYDIETGGLAYNTSEGLDVDDIRGDATYPLLQNTTFVIPHNLNDWAKNPDKLGINAYRILILCMYQLNRVARTARTPNENAIYDGIWNFFKTNNFSYYSFLTGTDGAIRNSMKDKFDKVGKSNPDSIDGFIRGNAVWNARLHDLSTSSDTGRNADKISNLYCSNTNGTLTGNDFLLPIGRYNPYGNDLKEFNGIGLTKSAGNSLLNLSNRHFFYPVFINRRVIMNLVKYARIGQQGLYR